MTHLLRNPPNCNENMLTLWHVTGLCYGPGNVWDLRNEVNNFLFEDAYDAQKKRTQKAY